MMVLKRKEIMAVALVVLIGVAGYLNWSYQDTIKVTDGESYIETGKKLGEAQYVNAKADETDKSNTDSQKTTEKKTDTKQKAEQTQSSEDYFTNAKLEKESARSRALEILKETAANESFDAKIREDAQKKILEAAENVEHEAAIENMAKAKGYSEISAYINEGMVNIAVKKDGLSENDIAKIQEIVVSQVNAPKENIKIIQVK